MKHSLRYRSHFQFTFYLGFFKRIVNNLFLDKRDFSRILSSDPDLMTMGPSEKYTLSNKKRIFQIG